MSRHYLRRALNGTNGKVSFKELPVYHDWQWGESYIALGNPLQKEEWIRQNIKEEFNYKAETTFDSLPEPVRRNLATSMFIYRYCIHRILTHYKLYTKEVWESYVTDDYCTKE